MHPGWRPLSISLAIAYALAPARALDRVAAVRVPSPIGKRQWIYPVFPETMVSGCCRLLRINRYPPEDICCLIALSQQAASSPCVR